MNTNLVLRRILLLYTIFIITSFVVIELLITAVFVFSGYLALLTPEKVPDDTLQVVSVLFLLVLWCVQLYYVAIKFGFIEYKSDVYDEYLEQCASF